MVVLCYHKRCLCFQSGSDTSSSGSDTESEDMTPEFIDSQDSVLTPEFIDCDEASGTEAVAPLHTAEALSNTATNVEETQVNDATNNTTPNKKPETSQGGETSQGVQPTRPFKSPKPRNSRKRKYTEAETDARQGAIC